MIDLDEFAFCLFSLGGSVYPCMCVFLRVSLTGFPHSYVISIDGWCAGKFCLKLFCTMASFVGALGSLSFWTLLSYWQLLPCLMLGCGFLSVLGLA